MTIDNKTVDMVRRNSNDFSFVETLDSMINNHEFRDGLQDFYVGKHNKYSFVWEALSVIGQEVGNTIYENVLNYIDLASNVDLCKTKTLQSISKSIGVDFSVLNGLENFPYEIREMVDVLSLNRKYILQTDFLAQRLIDDIASKAYQDIDDLRKIEIRSRITGEITTYTPGYITEQRYHDYLSGLYYDFMYEMVNLPYNTELSVPIWWIEERELIENEPQTDSEIESFKKKNCIEYSFNQVQIVDNIENCTDKLDNYSGNYRVCLEKEIERRSKTLRRNNSDSGVSMDEWREKYKEGYDSKLRTRYSYDRKRKVKQYIEMIQSQYNGLNDIDKITGRYDIDRTFFVIPEQQNNKYLIDKEKARKKTADISAVDTEMIKTIANRLAQITIYISKIRDILKIQSQKYYAKGTFNLLAFVINEYLIEFSDSEVFKDIDIVKTNVKANLSAHSFNQIDMIEYFDTTEYYNISCETSEKVYNKKTVNNRYWEDGYDSNTHSGFSFTDQQISSFYLDELGLNKQISDINDFLNVLFGYGATTSYASSVSSYVITEGQSEDITDSIKYSFLSHSGNKYSLNPYLNHKNRVHSSVQIHPYLKNFIEYTSNSYPIINAFYNDTVNEMTEQQEIERLSSFIGKYGETINVAVNNQYDHSGYKTRYETTPHDGQYDVEGYDGIFFPPAIEDFLGDSESFIESVSSMISHDEQGRLTPFAKYYQSLGYSNKCYKYIAEQLVEYKDRIIEIAKDKDQLSDVHDIFKYGTDGYNNMYILLKKYRDHSAPYKQRNNVPGQLWIRLKNNPIAFPAFVGKRSAVDTTVDFNANIEYLAEISCIGTSITDGSKIYKHVMECDSTDMSYFYDMEFSSTKDTLMLAVYPVNDLSAVGADGKYNEMISAEYYRDYQHADIYVSRISEWYDTVEERTKLYIESAGTGRYDKDHSYNSQDSVSATTIEGKSFVGFYKNGGQLSPVFVEKTFNKATNKYSLNDANIRVSFQMWYKNRIEKEYDSIRLNLGTTSYSTQNGEVQFSNYGDKMTFSFLTKPKESEISVQTYVGVHNGKGIASYTTQTSGYNIIEDDKTEMNSFDMLEEFVTTVDARIINGQMVNFGTKIYNLNSDASYIPSYPGQNGYTDISRTIYVNSQTNSFELLGDSNNIDNTINMVNPNADSSKDISSIFEECTHGIVWEDYDPENDSSLKQFVYNQRKDGGTDSGHKIWSIDIGKYGYTEKDLHSMSIVIYNKHTHGKNPYFIGKLSDISATAERPFVSLREDAGTYQDKVVDHEISSKSDPNLRVTGTYDYLTKTTNISECNHLENVSDIQLYSTNKKIVITFCPEDSEKEYFIKNDTFVVALCNPYDLKMFKYYHILDHRQAVSGGMIDGEYLSAIDLSEYNYLSDVPGLGGYDNLDFKYREQDVFDVSSDFYYFPCFNTAYPYRGVDCFFSQRTNKSNYNVIDLDGLFNQNNLFELKIDKSDILNDIGKFEIDKRFVDNECVMGYEDYVFDESGNVVFNDTRTKYDTIDPRILQCVEMYYTKDDGAYGKQEVQIKKNEETHEIMDRISEEYGYQTAFLEQTEQDHTIDYTRFEISSEDFEGVDKLLKIYVNYKKENDRSITLYFNYYNYISTPYIKFSNGTTTIDTRSGTYLKLKNGEDGLLRIELQFKHYDTDGDMFGFTNIVVATYRIFNVSDDKPKFVIHKVSGVDKEKKKYKTPETEIKVESQKIYVSENMVGKEVEFDINTLVSSNKILSHGTYQISYPSSELTCLGDYKQRIDTIVVTEPESKRIRFKTLKGITQGTSFVFGIRNVSIFDTDGMESKIETYPGQTDVIYSVFLRQETPVIEDLVLTEKNQGEMKIRI